MHIFLGGPGLYRFFFLPPPRFGGALPPWTRLCILCAMSSASLEPLEVFGLLTITPALGLMNWSLISPCSLSSNAAACSACEHHRAVNREGR